MCQRIALELGHGEKGKQQWLDTDGDLKQMYETHQRRKEILLWCHSKSLSPTEQKSRKRSSPNPGDSEGVPFWNSKTGYKGRFVCKEINCQMLKN